MTPPNIDALFILNELNELDDLSDLSYITSWSRQEEGDDSS